MHAIYSQELEELMLADGQVINVPDKITEQAGPMVAESVKRWARYMGLIGKTDDVICPEVEIDETDDLDIAQHDDTDVSFFLRQQAC